MQFCLKLLNNWKRNELKLLNSGKNMLLIELVCSELIDGAWFDKKSLFQVAKFQSEIDGRNGEFAKERRWNAVKKQFSQRVCYIFFAMIGVNRVVFFLFGGSELISFDNLMQWNNGFQRVPSSGEFFHPWMRWKYNSSHQAVKKNSPPPTTRWKQIVHRDSPH